MECIHIQKYIFIQYNTERDINDQFIKQLAHNYLQYFMIEQSTEKYEGYEKCSFFFPSASQFKILKGISTSRGDIFLLTFIEMIQNQQIQAFQDDKLYDIITFTKQQTSIPICGKKIDLDNVAFRCKQCGINDGCVICAECFQNSNHQGHHFQKIQVKGTCDCGDQQKWKKEGSCLKHQPFSQQIMIDENYSDLITKEIKFVFYLLFSLYKLGKYSEKLLKISKIFGRHFLKRLKQFNQKSLISNKITYEALISPYEGTYPKIAQQSIEGKAIIDIVWQLQKLNEMIDQLRMMYISMFTLKQFKERVLLSFIEKFNEQSSLIMSEFRFLGVQVFALQKTIQKIFKEGKWKPLVLNTDQNNLEILFESHLRYYCRIVNICEFAQPLNEKILQLQFMNSSICNLSSYQQKTIKDKQNSISYYRFQFILINRLTKILKVVQNNKKLLAKMIRDCIQEILKMKEPIKKSNYFLSCQRTLSYCLLTYSNGNLQQIMKSEFLEEIGLEKENKPVEVVNHILFSMLETLALCCYCLSSQQTINRYPNFWTFVFNRLPVIISLDLFLVKFCFSVLKKLGSSIKKFISPFLKKVSTIFKQENFHLSNTLNYDRKKCFGFLCSVLGLLMEVSSTDFFTFTIMTELGNNTRQTTEKIYGSLLASVQPIKLSDFSQGVSTLTQEKRLLEDFVSEYTLQEGNKIFLKPEYQSKFKPFSFKYLKQKKTTKSFLEMLQLNQKKTTLDSTPTELFVNDSLKDFVFDEEVVEKVVQMVQQYFQILMEKPNVLEVDIGNMALLIEQLAKLFNLVKSNRLSEFFNKLLSSPLQIRFSSELRSYLFSIINKKVKIKEDESQATKKELMRQRKKEKLQKMKEKRSIFLGTHKQKAKYEMEEQNQNSSPKCMICKLDIPGKSLAYMSLMRKTNSFGKYCLNVKDPVFCISSCHHLIHAECYKQFYNPFEHNYCNFCSSGSNLVVFMDERKENTEFMPSLEQVGTLAGILDKNYRNLLNKQNSMKEDTLSVQQKIVESLSLSLLQGIMWDPEFYFRQQHGVHHLLFQLLIRKGGVSGNRLREKIDIQMKESIKSLEQIEESEVQTKRLEKEQKNRVSEIPTEECWAAYRFIIKSILLLIKESNSQGMEDEEWSLTSLQSKFSPMLLKCIVEVIEYLRKDLKEEEIQELSQRQPLKNPVFTPLPQSLAELSQEIGKCPNCFQTTNQLAKCLLCDFKSCLGCKTCGLKEHAIKHHSGFSAFIRVDNGKVIYTALTAACSFSSLYKNYLGQGYEHNQEKYKFKLNQSSNNKVFKDIIRQRIQQETWYHIIREKKSRIHQQI